MANCINCDKPLNAFNSTYPLWDGTSERFCSTCHSRFAFFVTDTVSRGKLEQNRAKLIQKGASERGLQYLEDYCDAMSGKAPVNTEAPTPEASAAPISGPRPEAPAAAATSASSIGPVLKGFGTFFGVIGVITFVIFGIVLMKSHRSMVTTGWSVLIGGSLGSVFCACLLRGFGELVENTASIAALLAKADRERNRK